MLLNCGVGEDSWASLGRQGDPTSPSWRRSVLGVHWKDWCWSWNSNTFATWCEELTHWKRPWCWERLRAGGEGNNRGWDGWMASPTQWTLVWVNSGSWWWTGRPGILWFMGSQRVRYDWVTEMNWTFSWFWKMIYMYFFIQNMFSEKQRRNFPGGPVVENLPCNAGEACSIPDQRTKISGVSEELSPWATREFVCWNQEPKQSNN